MNRPRRYNFEGDDTCYILFLESRLAQLEGTIYSEGRQPSLGRDDRCSSPADHQNQQRHHQENRHQQVYGELQIIEHRPGIDESSSQPTNTRDGDSDVQKRAKREMNLLFSKVPEWNDWHNHIDEKKRMNLLLYLLPGELPDEPFEIKTDTSPNNASNNVRPILERYSQIIRARVSLCEQIRDARELVFVSLCVVAVQLGNRDSGYGVMRSYFGDKGLKQIDKLICGAKWANRLISDLLSTTRWGLKSWDIFFLAGTSIHHFARMAETSSNLDYLLHKFKSRPVDSNINSEKTWVPLAIPVIVKRLLGGSASLPYVCECLGYDAKLIMRYEVHLNHALDHNRKRKRKDCMAESSSKRQQYQRDHTSSRSGASQTQNSSPSTSLDSSSELYPEITGSDPDRQQHEANLNHTRSMTRDSLTADRIDCRGSRSDQVDPCIDSGPSRQSNYLNGAFSAQPDLILQDGNPHSDEMLHPLIRENVLYSASFTGIPVHGFPHNSQEEFNSASVAQMVIPSQQSPTEPFDPRCSLHPSQDHGCPVVQQSFSQCLPTDLSFDPRDALHPALIDQIMEANPESSSSLPHSDLDTHRLSQSAFIGLDIHQQPPTQSFDSQQSLKSSLIPAFSVIEQPPTVEDLPSNIPFNPRDDLQPALIDQFLATCQQPSGQPFDPRATIHPSQINGFPVAHHQPSLPRDCPFSTPEPDQALIDQIFAVQQQRSPSEVPHNFLTGICPSAS